MVLIVQQLLSGLILAMFLFLLAAGLSLIFGVGRVLNLAHGAFYMLGAYLLLTMTKELPSNFLLALLAASIIVALVGGLIEVGALRRVYGGGELYQALVTFAITLLIEEIIRIVWGAQYLSVPRPPSLGGKVVVCGIELPTYQLMLLMVGAIIGLVLWWVIYRTRWGVLVRAASMDREMLAALGINVPWLFTFVFIFGVWLAGVAGALGAPILALSPTMGSQIMAETFAVVVVGGLGDLKGGLISALLIGEVQAISLLLWPGAGLPLIFLLMAIILLVRPQGLLRKGQA